MSFQFDDRAFRRALQQETQSALDEVARNFEREFDRLRIQYAGRPVSEIRPAIRQMFADQGGSISDPELAEYAEAVSGGAKINVTVDQIRF
ncbi:hypothetical protein [Cellulomonas septica]|uniref:Uncharacterized protein n=1 Tax=Cellulomonas septica TaxID=285080 RepID=A0ABX1JXS3_9CELL|nr:hypothetical protein [Cellulomonas septica]NKY38016.1 hypothetical protein [Cellulomonas septica]